MRYVINRRGFTLVEVLIVVAFVGVLATLAYSLQFFGLKSFVAGGNQANIQQNVRLASTVLRRDLKNATSVGLVENSQPLEVDSEAYRLVDDHLIKVNTNFSTEAVIEDISITLEGINGSVMLIYEITGKNGFSLKNQILLNNLILEEIGGQIVLDNVYSLRNYRLIFTQ
ncbi:PilW family protein [Alkaliphilus hydrothermalis]|uniref:Prepilin-type N-terminal cleavage/methylation domain-containing protein n=1 Tax=Alkaliphilus hydrothermalis TaxID=1482730 RepID=A0ABS2NM36_9FIRM|nr:type II secretion system protein [Alkaliphilus hydrothermalis]MBM7613984.1 prepilin-type N-terminal cleavage/methylation domain-containing protein [Alkaliphilus hydrothermalis]